MLDCLIVHPNGGGEFSIHDVRIRILVGARETRGEFAVLETTLPPRGCLPKHLHTLDDQTLYVLEGQLELIVHDRAQVLSPGTMAFLPRGLPHAVRNPFDSPVKYQEVAVPAGLDSYLEELALIPHEECEERFVELGNRYGVYIEE